MKRHLPFVRFSLVLLFGRLRRSLTAGDCEQIDLDEKIRMRQACDADQGARRRTIRVPRKCHRWIGLDFYKCVHVEHVEATKNDVVPARAGSFELDCQRLHDPTILAAQVAHKHRLIMFVRRRLPRNEDHLAGTSNGDDAAVGWMFEQLRRVNELLVQRYALRSRGPLQIDREPPG